MKKKSQQSRKPAIASADPAKWGTLSEPCFEDTIDYDSVRSGFWESEEGEFLLGQISARGKFERRRCPYLWPKTPPKFRGRSHAILEPILQALRVRSHDRIIWHGNQIWRDGIKTDLDNKLTQEGMIYLFGEGLPDLERNLGRLLLDAVCTGDRKFKDILSAALKDAEKLFHRGKLLDAFFDWKHTLPDEKLGTMCRTEIIEEFLAFSGRSELSSVEWNRLKAEFALEDIPEKKPGPTPKMKKRR